MTSNTFQNNLHSLQGNLYNFAMMLTSNSDDAYDLVQDTTVKALDSQSVLTDDTHFKSWVFSIMRNIYISNYRRTAIQTTHIDTSDRIYSIRLSDSVVLEAPEGTRTPQQLSADMATMPQHLRKVFNLFAVGYSYTDISERLDCPVSSVKKMVAEARKLMAS